MLKLIKNIDYVNKKKLNIIEVNDKVFFLSGNDEKYIMNLFPVGKFGKISKIYECLCSLSSEFTSLVVYEDIGILNEKYCYRIIKNIEDVKSTLNIDDSYRIGYDIGRFIFKFHQYFQSVDCGRWYKHYNYRINRVLHEYGIGSYRGDLDYILFDYLEQNRFYLRDRSCTTIMGINRIDEIVISGSHMFQIIEEYKILRSDSYFEFRNMNLDSNGNEMLLTGIVDGYFEGKVPRTFFKLLGVYTIIENLYNIFSKKNNFENDYIHSKISQIIEVYDGFSSIYPLWYLNSKEKIKQL